MMRLIRSWTGRVRSSWNLRYWAADQSFFSVAILITDDDDDDDWEGVEVERLRRWGEEGSGGDCGDEVGVGYWYR